MVIKIAEYTFNSSTGVLPVFNDGFVYEYADVNNGDGTITRTITSDTLPTSISFSEKTKLVSVNYLDTSNVTNMKNMFYECKNLTTLDLSSFNTSNVTNMENMFYGCTNLTTLDLSNLDTSNVTNMENMFYRCTSLTTLDLSNLDTSDVTNMGNMFQICTNLTTLDLSNLDTSNVTDMSYMFYDCENLTTLDLSNFNTSEVTDMSYMFYDCKNLTTLDLSSFNTSNVRYMTNMFSNCTNLTTLDLSNLDISNVALMTGIFNSCSNLISVDMSNSDIKSINYIISALPTRTVNSYGTITVSKDVLSSVNKTTANSKYWNVVKPPEYTFTLDTLKYLLTNIKNKFVAKEELNNKVDKVEGKQLSANNFSDEDINNINNSFDDAEVIDNVSSELTTLKFYSGNNETKTIDLDI